ncbi:hypothetical protein RIF29_05928 [Crotalaria pallida]|uniref:RING-type E3 ubiquitin transferase n=1 Tax=Crotalaria pallida TaxID=3830 RepID=A0AAN9J3M8_CROPI
MLMDHKEPYLQYLEQTLVLELEPQDSKKYQVLLLAVVSVRTIIIHHDEDADEEWCSSYISPPETDLFKSRKVRKHYPSSKSDLPTHEFKEKNPRTWLLPDWNLVQSKIQYLHVSPHTPHPNASFQYTCKNVIRTHFTLPCIYVSRYSLLPTPLPGPRHHQTFSLSLSLHPNLSIQNPNCYGSMGTESANYTYMGRNFSELSINDDSSSSSYAFSDCNSDRSGEFQTATSQTRRFLIAACANENSDEFIVQLVSDLTSCSIDEQKQAAMQIRLLAKNKAENRVKIAKAGAIKPLVSIISSQEAQLQEYGVTAILNLSLCDENKELIVSSGAVKPLVKALSNGTSTAKENAACALLRLSQVEEYKGKIGRSGAIPNLVNLLENGAFRGKKDACTALYSLCSVKENKVRAVKAGIMRVLVELMADFESDMVDKAAYVASLLVSVPEARAAVVEEGGIPVLVEIVEVGTQRQKEIAVAILLQVCEDNVAYRGMVAREGAIPPLVALSQSGTVRAKQKVEKLIELLRQPRSGNIAARTMSEVSP